METNTLTKRHIPILPWKDDEFVKRSLGPIERGITYWALDKSHAVYEFRCAYIDTYIMPTVHGVTTDGTKVEVSPDEIYELKSAAMNAQIEILVERYDEQLRAENEAEECLADEDGYEAAKRDVS